MPEEPQRPLSTDAVEALLRARHGLMRGLSGGEDPAALELVARHLDGLTTPAEAARARQLLAADPTLAEAAALLADADGDQKVTSLAAARSARGRQPMARLWLATLAAVVLAGVGLALWLTGPGGAPPGPSGGLSAGLGGGGDALALTTRGRDGGLRPITTGASPGDTVAVGVVMAGPGYAAVVRVDAAGRARALYDDGGEARLAGASGGGVIDGGEVLVGSRCEWLVAAFGDRPFPTSALVAAVEAAPAPGAACPPPAPRVDGARRVVVVRLGR